MSPSGQPPNSSASIAVDNANDFNTLRAEWTRLWERSGLSFFSSWEWSWAWWQTYGDYLPKSARLRIFVYRTSPDGEVLAILPTYEVSALFGTHKRLILIGLGEPAEATIYTEFLDLICHTLTPELNMWVTEIFKRYDQVCPGIIRGDSLVCSVLNSGGLSGFEVRMVPLPNYRADLTQGFDLYLSQLSANSRNQARKILKQLKENSIALETARTTEERILWFHHLVTLHQIQWNKRGQEGAFKDPRIISFHTLLLSLAPQAQIYRLASSGTAIGYLYGFLTPERFDWYQMGIDLTISTLKRPGYGLHLATMRHLSTTQATRYYEFLPGTNQLKLQLGPLKENAFRMDAGRSTLKSGLVAMLSATVHRWRKT